MRRCRGERKLAHLTPCHGLSPDPPPKSDHRASVPGSSPESRTPPRTCRTQQSQWKSPPQWRTESGCCSTPPLPPSPRRLCSGNRGRQTWAWSAALPGWCCRSCCPLSPPPRPRPPPAPPGQRAAACPPLVADSGAVAETPSLQSPRAPRPPLLPWLLPLGPLHDMPLYPKSTDARYSKVSWHDRSVLRGESASRALPRGPSPLTYLLKSSICWRFMM